MLKTVFIIFILLSISNTNLEAGFFLKGADLLDTGNIYTRGIAFGYILGVFDTFQTYYPLSGHTAGDVVDSVTLYIRRNPRLWNEPAIFAITLGC